MMEFFKAEDFGSINQYIVPSHRAAIIANEKLEKALGPVVYGCGNEWWAFRDAKLNQSQSARLFNMIPLPGKCDHSIVEYEVNFRVPITSGKCGLCGKKLVARWEEA